MYFCLLLTFNFLLKPCRSMKLKELAYFHAEGYSGGALKHGPFALIDGDQGKFGPTPVIMIIIDDQHAHHMRTAAEEVKARGAEVIIITDNPKLADSLDDSPILIPSNGPLTALGKLEDSFHLRKPVFISAHTLTN